MSVWNVHARMWTLGFVLAAALVSGCGARMSLRVPSSAIAELPLERKLTLLDAENDLLAAQDARDLQEEKWLKARETNDDSRRRRSDADEQRAKAKKAGAPLDAWDAGMREAEARVKYAEADEELQLLELRTSESALLVAQAKYELQRANEVEAAALTGAAEVKVPDYQKQLERLQKALEERVARANKQREQAQAVKEQWNAARAELVKATGGALGSAWVP